MVERRLLLVVVEEEEAGHRLLLLLAIRIGRRIMDVERVRERSRDRCRVVVVVERVEGGVRRWRRFLAMVRLLGLERDRMDCRALVTVRVLIWEGLMDCRALVLVRVSDREGLMDFRLEVLCPEGPIGFRASPMVRASDQECRVPVGRLGIVEVWLRGGCTGRPMLGLEVLRQEVPMGFRVSATVEALLLEGLVGVRVSAMDPNEILQKQSFHRYGRSSHSKRKAIIYLCTVRQK